jgi:hypothetical protein
VDTVESSSHRCVRLCGSHIYKFDERGSQFASRGGKSL